MPGPLPEGIIGQARQKRKAMPSKTKKQKRFMAAAANNPSFAAKAGISTKVAKKFHSADQAKKGTRKKKP